MEKRITLTKNAIQYIKSFQLRKNPIKEFISIKKCLLRIESKNFVKDKSIVLTLSDGVEKGGNFYLVKQAQNISIEIGDVIEISSILIAKVQNHKLYFIKHIDKIYSNVDLIDNRPESNYDTDCSSRENSTNKKKNIEKYDISKYNQLSSLTMFSRHFCIYVKIVNKGKIRFFKHFNKDRKIFSFIMRDKYGDEMLGMCFGNDCDKVYSKIIEGNCYETSSGFITSVKQKGGSYFSDYCIQFNKHSEFKQMPELVPYEGPQSKIVSIKEIKTLCKYTFVNVLGIVLDQSNICTPIVRNYKKIAKRLLIGDYSGEVILLTIWDDKAKDNYIKNSIMLFTRLKISDFRDMISLSSTEYTEFILNPTVPQVNALKQFLANNTSFSQTQLKQLSPPNEELIKGPKLFLKEIHKKVDEIYDFERSVESKFYPNVKFKAAIYSISKSDKNYYYGCPDNNCKKKLTFTNKDKVFYCSKCDTEISDNKGTYYYTICLTVRDCTMESKIELFGMAGERLLGIECGKYQEYVYNKDYKSIDKIHQNILHSKYLFIGKAKKHINPIDNSIHTRIIIYHLVKIDDELEIKLCKDMIKEYKQLLTKKI